MISHPRLNKLGAYISIAAAMLLGSSQVGAAGFALNDQSATYIGNAYAGTCSATQDASTAYYNPAGMNQLKYSQTVVSGTYIKQNITLSVTDALSNGGYEVFGTNPSSPKANLNFLEGNIAWRVAKNFSLGMSIVEPFNLNTRYSYSDIAHVAALQNKIATLDYSPSVAIKINPILSIGAALDILRTNSIFSSGISWGLGRERNGYIINQAHGWTLGYHLGLLLAADQKTQFGLVYFSRFNPKLHGTSVGYDTSGQDGTGTVNYKLYLPAHVNVGITHQFNKKWGLLTELEWTRWSTLQNVTMYYNIPNMDPNIQPGLYVFNLRNTWRASLGLDYAVIPQLTLKAGVAYDQSPVTNSYRTAMLPDTDRYLFGLGARCTLSKYFALVAGYTHTYFRTAYINQTGLQGGLNQFSGIPSNQIVLNAKVTQFSNTFGLQVVLSLA